MNQVLINEKGELLEILQEPREPQENEHVVSLQGYYEVLNEQRFNQTIWDFDQNMWIGVGEQSPVEIQPISETQKLWDMIDYLVNSSY